MLFYRMSDGCEVAFVPLSEFKAAAADRDEWKARSVSIARELLLVRLREWSEDMWCAGWGFGAHDARRVDVAPQHPRESIRQTVATINDAQYHSGFSHPQRTHFLAAAKRIEELAEFAGGWWVTPDKFEEDSQ